jgi:hypothetical protein
MVDGHSKFQSYRCVRAVGTSQAPASVTEKLLMCTVDASVSLCRDLDHHKTIAIRVYTRLASFVNPKGTFTEQRSKASTRSKAV